MYSSGTALRRKCYYSERIMVVFAGSQKTKFEKGISHLPYFLQSFSEHRFLLIYWYRRPLALTYYRTFPEWLLGGPLPMLGLLSWSECCVSSRTLIDQKNMVAAARIGQTVTYYEVGLWTFLSWSLGAWSLSWMLNSVALRPVPLLG